MAGGRLELGVWEHGGDIGMGISWACVFFFFLLWFATNDGNETQRERMVLLLWIQLACCFDYGENPLGVQGVVALVFTVL